MFVTVDAARLDLAKQKNLLRPIESSQLMKLPALFRDVESYWFGLTYRARIIVYDKEKINPKELNVYQDLADPKWTGKILVRTSENSYNQSLLASIIAHKGEKGAEAWAKKIVRNMARTPKGNDRDQIKAIAAGQGEIAIVNSYYLGKMLYSPNSGEKLAADKVGIRFLTHEGGGTHIDISGAGVAKHAPHPDHAVRLLEFLTDAEAQAAFAEANYEYPVLPNVEWHKLLKSWGKFPLDELDLSKLGYYRKKAILIFNKVGWK